MDYLTVLDNIKAGKYSNTEDALTDAITVYRGIAADVKEMEATKERAKQIVVEIMQETGQVKAITAAGTAQFTAASARASYDTKALDALCASDDNVARLLLPHRKETQVAGSLTIK
jgi:hypothetical protein